MGKLFRRFYYLVNRRRLAAELESDMEFHREMAEQQGHGSFGNMLRLRETAHEAWGWTWIERLGQDLHYAARILVRSPGFTITAVLVLAVGIGVNVSAFSIFNLMALKPLPVRDPAALVRLQRRSPEMTTGEMPYPSAVFYRDHSRTLSAVMTIMGARVILETDPQPMRTNFVSANFFSELGVHAAYGRLFDPAIDEASGAAPVVVLGHDFWAQHFAADPSIVGKTIHLDGKPVNVVGIEPYAFSSLDGEGADVWLPITQQPYYVEGSKILTDTTAGTVRMWARLAPGVTARTAEAELLVLTNERRKQYPKDIWKGEYLLSQPGGHLHVMEPQMYQVAGMIAVLTLLILAVSCTNLGGLMLARSVTREREFGIRMAIGASRARIFRQLLTESLLLACLGSLVGLGLAYATMRITLATSDAPKWMSATPDWRVLLFVVGIALVACVSFGLAPALQIARQRQRKTLVRQILVGAQMAASCVLLIVASLLVRAVHHALYTNPGFGYERVLAIEPGLGDHGYTPAAAEAFLDQAQRRLAAIPGVASVSLVKLAPMGHSIAKIGSDVDGLHLDIYPNWIDPAFFPTMDIPLLAGRNFLPGEKNAVIVSESLARLQWPGENPLGKKYWDKDTVVGVVGSARINSLSEDDTVEEYEAAQIGDMPDMAIVIKTQAAPENLTPAVKSVFQTLDPKLFPQVWLLKAAFRKDMQSLELTAMLVSVIGIVAVLLAGVGMIGLVAFSVSQRLKEIAIRIALGARRGQVLGAVLRQFCWPVALGVVAGTGIAASGSQVLRKVLYGLSNLDPLSYAAAIVLLGIIVALAALLPARRALGLDLAKMLHYE